MLDQRLPQAAVWGGYPGGLAVEKGDAALPRLTVPFVVTWTDNHCHLDDERLESGAAATMAPKRAAGVDRMITIGTDTTRSRMAIEHRGQANDGVWATVGLHPHDASNGVDTIVPLLGEPRVVAIGECGLDYHYDHSPRDVPTRHWLAVQIDLAHERSLRLSDPHPRGVGRHLRPLACAWRTPRARCSTASRAVTTRPLAASSWARSCQFSGIVTFPKAPEVRDAAAFCPLDRLLVETDAPFLSRPCPIAESPISLHM